MRQTIETHPVQKSSIPANQRSEVPKIVTIRAYEVYCHIFQPQEKLITGNCRGGFGVGELVALLYARSFPKDGWRQRFSEAGDGMRI